MAPSPLLHFIIIIHEFQSDASPKELQGRYSVTVFSLWLWPAFEHLSSECLSGTLEGRLSQLFSVVYVDIVEHCCGNTVWSVNTAEVIVFMLQWLLFGHFHFPRRSDF